MSTNTKVALVTGGSRGIGRAIVEKFAADGYRVAACATKEGNLKGLPLAFAFACDVSRVEQVRKGVSAVVAKLGRVDVLVNNAGLAGDNPMAADASDELWHRILDVNLNGTYYFCKAAAPHLPDDTGRIINIASVLALRGVGDGIAYCAAKHGVLGFTRALAHHLSKRKITVNAVCPGWTRTDMAETRMKEIGIGEKDLARAVPLGRFVEPVEIAGLVAYLASDGARNLTGQALTMDGGTLA